MTVTGMVILARITPRTASSLSMKKGQDLCDIYSFAVWTNYIFFRPCIKRMVAGRASANLMFFPKFIKNCCKFRDFLTTEVTVIINII